MLTTLQTRLKKAGRLLPVALLPLLPLTAQAQTLAYPATSAVNTLTTYTDLGTAGTAITTANNDDANSAVQPIGFTFNYNGTAFTQFILNTNGLIKLGSTTPSTAALYYENFAGGTGVDPLSAAAAAETNLLMPFNFDLQQGTGTAEYRVSTTGTSPNQVCTIQWKNVSDKSEPGTGAPSQYANFSFQAKLYENGNIEFVYSAAVASANAAATRFPNVGLKGSGLGSNQLTLALKGVPTDPWSATTFINQNYGLQAHNVNKTGLPDAGRTYRFVPGTVAPGITNDDPAGAITLTVGATCTPTNATNTGATTTTPAGYANGTNPNTACGIAVNPKDVWFKFTTAASGPGSTSVILNVTGAPAGYLRLFSTTGGATGPFTEIACASSGANNAVSAPLTAGNLTPSTTYYVFVAGFGSNDTQGAFTICAVAPQNNDLAIQSIYTLGSVSAYASPVPVRVVIRNVGGTATTARTVTLTVSGATTYTNTQTVPVVAVGAATTVTFPSFPITAATGTNTITVVLSADDVAANNTSTTTQAVTASMLSYITPGTTTFSGGFGSNTTANATIYVKYRTTSTPTTVTAVTPTFAGAAAASNNYQVLILDATGPGGLPGTVLHTSSPRVRPLTGGADVVAIPGIAVSGDFYVAARQLTTTNFGLAYLNESPLRTGTFYISTDGIAFTDLAAANTTFRAAIDVTLRNPLATQNAALAATVGLYPNPAHQSFQLSVPAGSLRTASATLINALGQVVQSRQLNLPVAGGNTTFDVSSLAAGVYSLQLKSGNDLVVKRVVVE